MRNYQMIKNYCMILLLFCLFDDSQGIWAGKVPKIAKDYTEMSFKKNIGFESYDAFDGVFKKYMTDLSKGIVGIRHQTNICKLQKTKTNFSSFPHKHWFCTNATCTTSITSWFLSSD